MNYQGNIRSGYGGEISSYVTDTGTVDNYVVDLVPEIGVYTEGLRVRFIAASENTGPCTLEVNNLGPRPIKKKVSQDLESGDILQGLIVEVVYDGSVFQYQIGKGTPGSSGSSGISVGSNGTSGMSGRSYGSSGSSGRVGSSGISGAAGSSGVAGTHGSSGTGVLGTAGSHGSFGTSGATSGTSGSSGNSGVSYGSPGSSGSSGRSIGSSGFSGSSGQAGSSGSSASPSSMGNCVEFQYNASVITNGHFYSNNTSSDQLTQLAVYYKNLQGVNLTSWLTDIPAGGYFTITRSGDAASFGVYQIISRTPPVPTVTDFAVISLQWVSGSSFSFIADARYSLCFMRKGPGGTSGTSGVAGEYMDGGFYAPVPTPMTNVASVSMEEAQYLFVGKTVTVSGKVTVVIPQVIIPFSTIRYAGGISKFCFTKPLGGKFDYDYRCGGTAYDTDKSQTAEIYAGVFDKEDKLVFEFFSPFRNGIVPIEQRTFTFHYHATYRPVPCAGGLVIEVIHDRYDGPNTDTVPCLPGESAAICHVDNLLYKSCAPLHYCNGATYHLYVNGVKCSGGWTLEWRGSRWVTGREYEAGTPLNGYGYVKIENRETANLNNGGMATINGYVPTAEDDPATQANPQAQTGDRYNKKILSNAEVQALRALHPQGLLNVSVVCATPSGINRGWGTPENPMGGSTDGCHPNAAWVRYSTPSGRVMLSRCIEAGSTINYNPCTEEFYT